MNTPTPSPTPTHLTVPQTCERLNCSRRTVEGLLKSGALTAIRYQDAPHARRYISIASIEDFLRRRALRDDPATMRLKVKRLIAYRHVAGR